MAEKCYVDCQRIDPCTALNEVMEDQHNSAWQRLTYETVRNVKTMRVTGILIVLRSGEHRKMGICLNWCPFCGEKLAHARENLNV